jgi:hypothetical protein
MLQPFYKRYNGLETRYGRSYMPIARIEQSVYATDCKVHLRQG